MKKSIANEMIEGFNELLKDLKSGNNPCKTTRIKKMKINPSKCQLVDIGNCPSAFDFTKTLSEFKTTFVDYESDTESFDNENDTAVVFVPNEVDPWEFFKSVYSLKPDEFLFEKVSAGVVVYMSWYEPEAE